MEKLLSSSHTINKTGLNFYRYICFRCFNRHCTSIKSPFHNENIVKKSFKVCENRHIYVTGSSGHYISDNRRMPVTLNRKQMKLFNSEYRAFFKLLERSGYHGFTGLFGNQCRFFTTSDLRCRRKNDHNSNQDDNDDQDDKDKENNKNNQQKLNFPWTLFFVMTIIMLLLSKPTPLPVSWQTFEQEMLLTGEVKDISVREHPSRGAFAIINVHPGAIINNQRVTQTQFVLQLDTVEKFEEKVRKVERAMGLSVEDQVTITYDKHEYDLSERLMRLLIIAMAVSLVFKGMSYAVKNSGVDSFYNMMEGSKHIRVDRSKGKKLNFKDVAGLKAAKIEVMEFVDYIKNPNAYTTVGAKMPKGALLLGPPGCGKTLLAKAVAGEADVPFFSIAGSEFVEVFGGMGAKRVRNLFSEARKNTPCIVFIDEIDAIGKKRYDGNSSEEEQTLNQILVEMDGMGTVEGVIVLASTNRAHVLDQALLRPGRFDRHITIDLPTVIERLEIFEMYLKQLRLEGPISKYAPKLSQMTPGMSGADIANLCNEAALYAASKKQDSVDTDDFNYALERILAGRAKKSSQLTPEEKKMLAYHESGHALVGWMLQHTDALLKISIVPRVGSALGFAQYMPSDQKLYSTEQLFERMCMALGGRAAESIIFNHITTGAEDDLKRVTQIAKNKIKLYGMSDRVGHLSFPDNENEFSIRPYSQALAAVMDEEVRALIGRAYRQAEKIIQDNKDKLITLAEALLDKEVLSYDDVTELIGQPPHGPKQKIDSDIFSAYDIAIKKPPRRRKTKTR